MNTVMKNMFHYRKFEVVTFLASLVWLPMIVTKLVPTWVSIVVMVISFCLTGLNIFLFGHFSQAQKLYKRNLKEYATSWVYRQAIVVRNSSAEYKPLNERWLAMAILIAVELGKNAGELFEEIAHLTNNQVKIANISQVLAISNQEADAPILYRWIKVMNYR